MNAKVIAIAMQKGDVGKTTTCANLGIGLAQEGILSHPEGVDLLPANIELSGMEISLIKAMSRETILKQYLEMVKKDYQYILLDTQPSLGMLTVNALAEAD